MSPSFLRPRHIVLLLRSGTVLWRQLMKKLLLITAALLTLGAALANAQSGTSSMGWTDCNDATNQGATFACNDDAAIFVLETYFIVDSDMTFAGTTAHVGIVVDADVSATPWWQLSTGGCRSGGLTLNTSDPGSVSGCAASIYTNTPGIVPITGGVVADDPSHGGTAGPANLYIETDFARADDTGSPITAGTKYQAMQFKLNTTKTVATPCAGCSGIGATFTLRELDVYNQTTEYRQLMNASPGGHLNAFFNH